MKVFAMEYSYCKWESACFTVSLHTTRRGAEIAKEVHKLKIIKEQVDQHLEYVQMHENDKDGFLEKFPESREFEYFDHDEYNIREIEILE